MVKIKDLSDRDLDYKIEKYRERIVADKFDLESKLKLDNYLKEKSRRDRTGTSISKTKGTSSRSGKRKFSKKKLVALLSILALGISLFVSWEKYGKAHWPKWKRQIERSINKYKSLKKKHPEPKSPAIERKAPSPKKPAPKKQRRRRRRSQR